MRRMRRVVGRGIPVESYDDSTWERGGYTSEMEHPGRGDWASGFQDDLPGNGRPAELPGGGMPGQSGNKDGNTGALPDRHVLDTVVILEERNSPHPRCARCDKLVPRRSLNGRHPDTAQCAREEERKRRRLADREMRDSTERASV